MSHSVQMPGPPPAALSVSVVIPCFNSGPFLVESVKSVLNDSVPNATIEVVVVDDRSTDPETQEVLTGLARDHVDGGVRVVVNQGRKGVSAARNLGVRESRGEWIAFLDADDTFVPGGLHARLRALDDHPEAEWIGGDFVLLHPDGTIDPPFLQTRRRPARHLGPAYKTGRPLVLRRPAHIFLESLLTHTDCVIVKKVLLERVGGFDEDLVSAEDYHLWVRLCLETDFHFVPTVVAQYRQHDKSTTHQRPTGALRMDALRRLRADGRFRFLRQNIDLKVAESLWDDVRYHRIRGNFGDAGRAALAGLRLQPLNAAGWRHVAAIAARRR